MRVIPGAGINPIIVKELRSRMRGARAFAILTAMLLLMGSVSYALYRIVLATTRYSSFPASPQIGQALFSGLAVLELMVVCFITPAVTAGAISSEQEKQTYEMLLATPMRPASILWGKLISALSYVFLLIFAAIPMASLVFIFGGVAPRDMIKALIILVAVTVTLGVVGIFMSTLLGRTGRATVLSYLVVLALLVGPAFAYILVGVIRQTEPPRWILVPNPVSALFSALTPAAPASGPSGFVWGMGMALGGNLGVLTRPGTPGGLPRPLYHYTLPLYAALTLVLYLLATRLVQPTRRWRLDWKAVLTGLGLLSLLGTTVAFGFIITAHRYENVSIFATPTPAAPPPPAMIAQEVVKAVPPPLPVPTDTPPATLPSLPPTSTPEVPEPNSDAIYAAVVRQLYTLDHTFGDQPPNFPTVYLVRITDDSVGDPGAPRSEPWEMPASLQSDIVTNLQDLPAEFIWVGSVDEVPRDSTTHAVAGEGAIMTLGNIHVQEDGSALVSAKLYFSPLGATGKTYVLEQVDGTWQITGSTGVQWIS